MITLKNVTRAYHTDVMETHALHEVSLSVTEGEFVALTGPSGCGKTTLLNIIGLLDVPTSGKYHLAGKEVSALSAKDRVLARRGKIGFVFQSFYLIDELTVRENAALPLVYLKWSKEAREKRVATLLDQLGISHRADHYPSQLSGGQQQRTAVARAVAARPRLILADEPTGNLDSVNGEEVMRILKSLHEDGTTIIMATHSTAQAAMARRVIRVFDGEIVGEESVVAGAEE